MSKPAKSSRSDRNTEDAASLSERFNQRSTDVSEVEIKFLIKNQDRRIFQSLENYFDEKGWITHKNEPSHLLSRQIDTPTWEFMNGKLTMDEETTLRVRGRCVNSNLNSIVDPDVCVKTAQAGKQNQAMDRGEYETHTNDFFTLDFNVLRERYPVSDYPEINEILDSLNEKDLLEFFRIDCQRSRFLVEVPEEVTGIAGKTFVTELCLDDVVYVMDVDGLEQPIILGHDLEVECEVMQTPCKYSDAPPGVATHCSPLTRAEINQGIEAIQRHIIEAGEGKLEHNTDSKARRGYLRWMKLRDVFAPFLQIITPRLDRANANALTTAFKLKAENDKLSADPEFQKMQEENRQRIEKVQKGHALANRLAA